MGFITWDSLEWFLLDKIILVHVTPYLRNLLCVLVSPYLRILFCVLPIPVATITTK